jgi:predicted site-specific integrase-resolvase
VTGEWRKLHNEELNDLYSLPNIVWVVKSRRMRWSGHVLRMVEDRGVHRVLVGKPKGKRPLGRLSFKYSATCFGHSHAHHQELINCNRRLWFTVGTWC